MLIGETNKICEMVKIAEIVYLHTGTEIEHETVAQGGGGQRLFKDKWHTCAGREKGKVIYDQWV